MTGCNDEQTDIIDSDMRPQMRYYSVARDCVVHFKMNHFAYCSGIPELETEIQ